MAKAKYQEIIFAGFGPFAFSSHLRTLIQNKIQIPFVIESEDQALRAREILDAVGYNQTKVLTIPTAMKSASYLPLDLETQMLAALRSFPKALFVISSEPQGHEMWIRTALKTSLDIFVDKPLIARPAVTLKKSVSNEIYQSTQELVQTQKSRSAGRLFIGLDRPATSVGREITEWIKVNRALNCKVDFVSASYCFGEGSLLAEQQNKENHPYKYGYGILYHSGFHILDMLSRFLTLGLGEDYDLQVHSFAKRVPGVSLQGETSVSSAFLATQGGHQALGNIYLSSLGFTRRDNFKDEVKNPYHQLKKVRAERYEIHMGMHKKLIYTGHNSKKASQEDRIEKIEIFDSSPDRKFDYLVSDHKESGNKFSALENVLFNEKEAFQVEDTLDSHRLLHVFSVSLCAD